MAHQAHEASEVVWAGIAIIVVLLLPAALRVYNRLRSAKRQVEASPYEDADGVATEDSEREYWSAQPVKYIVACAILGGACSLAMAIYATVFNGSKQFEAVLLAEFWVTFLGWLCVSFQTFVTSQEVIFANRYSLGIWAGWTSFVLCAVSAMPLISHRSVSPHWWVELGLCIAQIVLSFMIFVLNLAIPRRPNMFFKERLVDEQRSVSVWSNYTYWWATPHMRNATNRALESEDLPFLDSYTRSQGAALAFNAMSLKSTVPLWLRLFWAHRSSYLFQFVLALLTSMFAFMPQLAMLQLLRALEARSDPNSSVNSTAWLWVVGLAVSSLLSVLVENRMNWSMWADVSIPMRAELSAIIFEKAMRRKDCKEPPQKDEEEADKSKATDVESANGAKKDDKDGSKKAKSDQDTINLLAIDTSEVAQFGAVSMMYSVMILKMIVCFIFLWVLIGWEALLAGLATNLLITPVNYFLTKWYSSAQASLMKSRDARTKVLRETLNGIRQIKFSALEDQWESKIDKVRTEELKHLWQIAMADTCMKFSWTAAPIFLAVVSLSVYTLLNGALTASVAFTAIGLLMHLEGVLGITPELISMGISAKVAVDRIQTFCEAPEKTMTTYPSESISFRGVSLTFPSDTAEVDKGRFTLRDLDLQFPNKELSVISGKTGSGKSLLLQAILGEVDVISGIINVPRPETERYDSKAVADNWILPNSIAYVSQTPWIENASIKNNILFGLPFDTKRYDQIVKACALTKDLEMLQDGDQTEVGASGISLSGGQRWRLTLARALYSRAGILIMDDLFSALDAHVGKEIYENALTGELAKDRTRILVTHHVSLCLAKTKYTVRLANGTIEFAGLNEDLAKTGDLDTILKNEAKAADGVESATAETNGKDATGATKPNDKPAGSVPAKAPKKLIEDETKQRGSVRFTIFAKYLNASGGFIAWFMILFAFIIAQVFVLGRSWWVKLWTASYAEVESTPFVVQAYNMVTPNATSYFETTASGGQGLGYWIGIYILMSFVTAIAETGRCFLLYVASLSAAKKVFRELTHTVLRMPLRWIDTVPLGRILNRFTADVTIMDNRLARELALFASSIFELLGVLVAAVFVSPYIILLAAFMLGTCTHIANGYLEGAREVKRLEAVLKSPIFEHFGSALKGITTIRAFDKAPEFIERMYDSIDKYTVSWWHNWLFNRWVGMRMSLVGCLFASSVAAVVLLIPSIDASLAGFALAFALDYSMACILAIRLYATAQTSMNSTERVVEYTDLKTEPMGGEGVPASWPSEGKIEVQKLVLGYAEGLPDILKGLTFTVGKNERIGVVGRTGAGKSTLALALFRFLEAREGTILIDGIDISTIKLKDLRTRLAIIPQDPVLFSGTIRSNLDPFEQSSDDELMKALQSVHLIPSPNATPPPEADSSASSTTANAGEDEDSANTNTNIFRSLSSAISDGGQNISQGQRQLLCLAREIVARPKVMILDEATSAVDMATDQLIQRSIRDEFANTSLLVVAHRLSTVADFDKILVMGDGRAVEFGAPAELMAKGEEGVFAGMVRDSGEREKLEEMIMMMTKKTS